MKILTVRLDDAQYDELARVARSRSTSLSDLARKALGETLDPAAPPPERPREVPEAPETLSAIDRHALAMLHRIMAHTMPDEDSDEGDPAYHRKRARVLEMGWTAEYSDEFIAIQPEVTRADCTYIMDVFDMFTWLERSFDQLDEEERATFSESDKDDLQFDGFDLNNPREGRLWSYAKHLIDEGKWIEMAKYFDDDHDRGNSHRPTVATYDRMLAVFNPIWRQIRGSRRRGFTLDATQIRQVLAES